MEGYSADGTTAVIKKYRITHGIRPLFHRIHFTRCIDYHDGCINFTLLLKIKVVPVLKLLLSRFFSHLVSTFTFGSWFVLH